MDNNLRELLKQLIIMICYHPDFPQSAKNGLLNKASECGITFHDPDYKGELDET
jgi:hypothetical protein